MTLKMALDAFHHQLGELETAARKLENQNFADIIKSARGRLSQAAEHHDVEAVGEQLRKDMHGDQEPLPFPSGAANPGKPSFNPGSGSGAFDPTAGDPALGA